MKASRTHWSIDLIGGCFGIAIALGLVRFDFGIIGNLMADAQWIDVEDIGTLAAINMFGYLTGCIQQATVKSRATSIRYMQIAMITIIASIALEGRSTNLPSQSVLRLLCGWGSRIAGERTCLVTIHLCCGDGHTRRAAALIVIRTIEH